MQVDAYRAPTPPPEADEPDRRRGDHPARRWQWRLPTWATALLWVVVAVLGTIAVARVVAWDALEPFAVANAVTAFIYLPAWIIVIVAILGRRAVLAAAALVIVIAQILFLLPELDAAQPVPTWTTGAPTTRVFDANVYFENPSMTGYAHEISALRPDLVILEEATPALVGDLTSSGALAGLPYRIEIRQWDPSAFFVASRYPLTEQNVVYDFDRPLILQATVRLPSGPFSLWVTHTVAPLPSSFGQWENQLAVIHRLVRQRGTDKLLLVGDFNATWGNKGFRSILDDGLTDGAAARGHPFSMTWSQIMPILPPLVRIDHVLTGSGVAVTAVSTVDGPGSDHRAEWATVAFRR